MTDSTFEQSLARQLQAYAEGGVRPVDRYSIAEELIRSGARRPRFGWYPASGRWVASPSVAIIVIGLVLALLAAVVVGGLVLRQEQDTTTPGRNGLIAYSLYDGAGSSTVHVMNPDGSGDRVLTEGSRPVYSADGEVLVFSGLEAPGSDRRIMVADGDGADIRDVGKFESGDYQLSPDGTQFAVSRDVSRRDWSGRGGIWLVQIADGSSRVLVPPPDDETAYWNLRWSPDGRSIAYAVMTLLTSPENSGMYRSSIAIVDVATGRTRTVTSRVGTESAEIAWAPDGERLAFTGLGDDSPMPSFENALESFYPPQDVFAINADGTGEHNVSNSTEAESSIGWSPSGTEISFNSWTDGAGRLVIHRVDGTAAATEARSSSLAGWYSWSPDGRLILVVTTEDLTPADSEDQVVHTTMRTLDASFLEDPVTIAEWDFNVGGVSWQWLKP